MDATTKRIVTMVASLLVIFSAGSFSSAQAGDNPPTPVPTYAFPPCTSQGYVYSIAISHDNQSVLASLNRGEVRLWNIATGEVIRTFQHGEFGDLINDVAFSPDDRLIATGDRNSAKVWRVADGSLLWEFPQDILKSTYTYVDFLPHGNQLMISSAAGASIRDLTTGEQLHVFPGYEWTEDYGRAQLSPDGRYVTTRKSDTAEVFVWDAASGELIHQFAVARADMPNSFIASTEIALNENEALALWDIQSGQQIGSLELGEGFIDEWRFSPKGNYALILREHEQAPYDYTTDLWDVSSGQKIYSFHPRFFLRNSLFLPDGENLVIASPDDENPAFHASIWNLPTQTVTRSFAIDGELVTSAVTSDGRYWITSSQTYQVSVWDLQTGERVRTLC